MSKKSRHKKDRQKSKAKVLTAEEQVKSTNTKILFSVIGILVVSMVVRVALSYDYTFIQEGIVFFRGNDAWYHMRLSENMLANFPHMMTYDPYTNYPTGTAVITPPLFSWLAVACSYIVSLAPTAHTVAVVSCWLPPVMATLTCLPVYFIGKALHSRWAGVLAAAMVALLPTQFYTRSQLGFADHHVLEILLASTMVMCLVWAYKGRKLWLYAVAGVPLGLYFLTWHGAAFMLLPLGIWFVVQFVVDRLRGQLDTTLWQGVAATTFVGFLIFLPFRQFSANTTLAVVSFMTLIVMAVGVGLVSYFLKNNKVFWPTLGGCVGIGILGMLAAKPEYFDIVRDMFSHIFPTSPGVRTIAESKPTPPSYLIVVYGVVPLFFGLGIYYTIKRHWQPLLVAIWGVVMLVAMFSQQRWGYYLTVPMVLMAAFAFFEVREVMVKQLKYGVSLILCVALMLAPAFGTIKLAQSGSLMTPDWWNALVWMRESTPVAFNGDVYLELDSRKQADYGVMSWWDYGHWITEVGRRVPYSNPFQNQAVIAAEFFLEGSDPEGLKYVIIDQSMVTGKFYAMRLWAGLPAMCTQEEHDNTVVVRMWNEQMPGYKLVFANESVKIFEKLEGE